MQALKMLTQHLGFPLTFYRCMEKMFTALKTKLQVIALRRMMASKHSLHEAVLTCPLGMPHFCEVL